MFNIDIFRLYYNVYTNKPCKQTGNWTLSLFLYMVGTFNETSLVAAVLLALIHEVMLSRRRVWEEVWSKAEEREGDRTIPCSRAVGLLSCGKAELS